MHVSFYVIPRLAYATSNVCLKETPNQQHGTPVSASDLRQEQYSLTLQKGMLFYFYRNMWIPFKCSIPCNKMNLLFMHNLTKCTFMKLYISFIASTYIFRWLLLLFAGYSTAQVPEVQQKPLEIYNKILQDSFHCRRSIISLKTFTVL